MSLYMFVSSFMKIGLFMGVIAPLDTHTPHIKNAIWCKRLILLSKVYVFYLDNKQVIKGDLKIIMLRYMVALTYNSLKYTNFYTKHNYIHGSLKLFVRNNFL